MKTKENSVNFPPFYLHIFLLILHLVRMEQNCAKKCDGNICFHWHDKLVLTMDKWQPNVLYNTMLIRRHYSYDIFSPYFVIKAFRVRIFPFV